MLKDFEDHGPTIDDMNDVGNAYDALQKGMEQVTSPIRRSSSENHFPATAAQTLHIINGTTLGSFPPILLWWLVSYYQKCSSIFAS